MQAPAGAAACCRCACPRPELRQLPAGEGCRSPPRTARPPASSPARPPQVERLRAQLEADGVVARALQTSHAFHSSMMDAAVPPFEARGAQGALCRPPTHSDRIRRSPARWLTDAEATDPALLGAPPARDGALLARRARRAGQHRARRYSSRSARAARSRTLARQHAGQATRRRLPLSLLGRPARRRSAPRMLLAQGALWTSARSRPAALRHTRPRAAACAAHLSLRAQALLDRHRQLPAPAAAAVPRAFPAPAHARPRAATSPHDRRSPDHAPPPALATAATARSRVPHSSCVCATLFEDVAGIDLADVEATGRRSSSSVSIR